MKLKAPLWGGEPKEVPLQISPLPTKKKKICGGLLVADNSPHRGQGPKALFAPNFLFFLLSLSFLGEQKILQGARKTIHETKLSDKKLFSFFFWNFLGEMRKYFEFGMRLCFGVLIGRY